jgi:hypothetical protein
VDPEPRQDPRQDPRDVIEAWIAARAPQTAYGFLVGLGACVGVGMGVRPTGWVANGFGLPLGDSDGFGANPQMVQLKRP